MNPIKISIDKSAIDPQVYDEIFSRIIPNVNNLVDSLTLNDGVLEISVGSEEFLRLLEPNSGFQQVLVDVPRTDLNQHVPVDSPMVYKKLSLSFPSPLVFNHSAVINLVGEHIPDELLLVASLGKKFVPPIHLDKDRILLDLKKLESRDQEEGVDGDLLNEANHIVKKFKPRPLTDIDRHILHIFDVSKEFLKENPNICVSSADKGNISIIFDKRFYINKMEQHLNSANVYQKLTVSSHVGLVKRNHYLLKKLKESEILKNDITCVVSQETQVPMLYGLLKPQKNFAVRPIMSSINVVGEKLFKMTVEILDRLDRQNGYSLKNTQQLIDKMKGLSLKPGDKLFSIDVSSMFTNIQPDLALSIILPKLSSVSNLPPGIFSEIFLFITKIATEFRFNGSIYKQVSGLPMGTKGSPVIASIVLTHIFNEILPQHEPVTYLGKYVDDSIIITTRENAFSILSSLNRFDPRIKFTIEEEDDSFSLNILDVTLIRSSDQKIVTKWYCKPFASNRLVNWFSNHEPHTIENTAVRYVSNMLFYSDPIFHKDLLEKAKIILFKNSFPSSVIDDFIVKAMEIVAFQIFGENDAENTQFFSTLAPIPLLRAINGCSKKNLSNVKYVNTYIDYNSGSAIFSNLKDAQEIENRTNIVVRTSCKSCKFFRIVPITTPLILYKILNLSQLFHPFNSIQQHISSTSHIGFHIRIEQQCKSVAETLRYGQLLCKKHKIPGKF